MARVQVGEVELDYELHGTEGDPLVLVHGSWVDRTTWDLVVPMLEGSFQVLTYDRRGHGRSERRATPTPSATDAADLAGLLETLGHLPAHVVGSSLGGSIALQLAAARPDLLRSLAVHEAPLVGLLGTPLPDDAQAAVTGMGTVAEKVAAGDHRGAARTFVEAVALGPGAWDRLPASVQEGLVRNSGAWLDEYHDAAALTIDPVGLQEFYAPALLTTGAESRRFFATIADRVAGMLPNAQRRELEGTGHVPHLTHPTMFVGVLVSFCLDRVVPTS